MPVNSLIEFFYNGKDARRIFYLSDARTVVNVIKNSYLANVNIQAEKVKWVFLYRVIEKDMEMKLFTLISRENKDLLLKASSAANEGFDLIRSDPDKAIQFLTEAVHLFELAGGYEVKGDILNDTGLAHAGANMHGEALKYFNQSLELFENRDWERYVCVLMNRASLYEENFEWTKAIADLNYAIWIAITNNLGRQQVMILNNAGYILYCNRKFDEALKKYRQVLSIKSKLNYPAESIAQTCFNIAVIHENASQVREAINAYRNCLELPGSKSGEKKLDQLIGKHIDFLERKIKIIPARNASHSSPQSPVSS